MINQINSPSGSSVSITLTSDNSTINYEEVTAGTTSISAGRYDVTVRNIGMTNITVGGDTITPGNTAVFQAYQNLATGRLDLTPAFDIVVPAGGRASYKEVIPSA